MGERIHWGVKRNLYRKDPNIFSYSAYSFIIRIIDYIGNTVVQRLFEKCTEETKTAMLEHIAPHLAAIDIHKNGTWAAQKIIDTIRSPDQVRKNPV